MTDDQVNAIADDLAEGPLAPWVGSEDATGEPTVGGEDVDAVEGVVANPAKRLPLHPSAWQGVVTWEGKPTIRMRMMEEPDWETFEAKLRGGIAPWSLAKEIVARPHFADVGMKSAERVLSRIRESFAKGRLKGELTKQLTVLPVQFRNAVERLQGVPEVKKLTKLIADQVKRVEMGVKLEAASNMPLPGVKEEVELLWKMQLSLIEVKQKLGLLHAEPMKMQALLGVVTGQLNGGTGQEGANDLPKTLDAAARQRVLQAVKKMRKMIGTRLTP